MTHVILLLEGAFLVCQITVDSWLNCPLRSEPDAVHLKSHLYPQKAIYRGLAVFYNDSSM